MLACALPDDIAAVGLVTVEVLIGPCPNSVPVIAFHGTADAVVPYDGGEVRGSEFRGSTVRGAEGNMVRWAELDGCGTEPERSEVGSEVTHRVYPDCDDGTEVELYTIEGGGHTWPGSPIDVARLGANTDQIDATDLILDFFAEHPLPEDVSSVARRQSPGHAGARTSARSVVPSLFTRHEPLLRAALVASIGGQRIGPELSDIIEEALEGS